MTVIPQASARLRRPGRLAGAALVVVTVVVSMPFWAASDILRTGVEMFCFLALAQLWNLLAGYGGLVSFGQQAFIGIGGYALVLFAYRLGLSPYLALPIGAGLSALFAWPMSRLLFRLNGAYFAVGTWIMAECWRLVFANWSWLGGGSGISITATMRAIDPWWREALAFWISGFVGLGAVAGLHALLRSRWGLALTALRDSEPASEAVGISVGQVKTWVYVAASGGAGLVGGLIFLTKLRLSPDAAVSINWSVMIVFIVVIGGVGTIEGPILGCILYFLLREYLADFGAAYMIAFGALAILVMLTTRGGLWGEIRRRWGIELFPVQRRLDD